MFHNLRDESNTDGTAASVYGRFGLSCIHVTGLECTTNMKAFCACITMVIAMAPASDKCDEWAHIVSDWYECEGLYMTYRTVAMTTDDSIGPERTGICLVGN
jgi:hypothetical protein